MRTLLVSKPRTATDYSVRSESAPRNGVLLSMDVTAVTATPSLTLTVEVQIGLDNWITVFTAAAPLTAVGRANYLIGLGLAGIVASGDITEVDNVPITDSWRVRVIHADADSATYSVTASNV